MAQAAQRISPAIVELTARSSPPTPRRCSSVTAYGQAMPRNLPVCSARPAGPISSAAFDDCLVMAARAEDLTLVSFS